MTDARAVPIYQTSSYVFRNSQHAADRFGLKDAGNIYGRLTNPTEDVFEKRIAALEGGTAALAVASGAAAITYTIENLAQQGDHIVSAKNIYGGSFNLLEHTLPNYGITTTFVDIFNLEEVENAIQENTKAVYIETLGNPNSDVVDIEAIANIAHKHKIPLVVDNTFATPYLVRPIEYGADIVMHSTTKYIDGHALGVGGVVVDSGNFDWAAHKEKFAEFSEPDPSYHGCVYTESFGKAAYIVKARVQLIRDLGCLQSPQNAFYINQGLETLPLRMQQYCKNALEVAKFLEGHEKIASVAYPGLKSHVDYELAQKYLKNGCSGVISLVLKGGRDAGAKFIDSLKMISLEVHVADIKSCVLHPASSTHRQLTDEQLAAAGIEAGSVRLSVGLEDVADTIADLKQALDQI